ncbi:sulfur carrier protein ThiS [Kitasatospora purpeofusca]|uniref:Sulfur carrier protein ThiS n=1 Tax=Kitasatospora purpeofusca TaxID=67352 RepID=A0ABZ1U6S8_9ACTN|nr:sulfur carrier protein ThiS [Kitasatospora purpeofusca]
MSPRTSDIPPNVRLSVNGEPREVPASTTLAEVVATLSEAHSGVAAALNETVVPRTRWPLTALSAGDRIEILTAVQGG